MAAPCKKIVATGFIIFRRISDQIQYLLLHTSYENNLWTPPKGHVDPGESEQETAFRETQEEAGFEPSHLRVITDWEKTLHYTVRGKSKRVVYWLAELRDPQTPVILSKEHREYRWLDLPGTLCLIPYPDMKETMQEAHTYITSNEAT